jgi:hypothetical protein
MKKSITILIILSLLTISLGISINPVNAANTVITVGQGSQPVVSGSIIAFLDQDSKVAYYDISKGELFTTTFQADSSVPVSIGGDIIAFSTPYPDYTISYYYISTESLVNTGIRGVL